MRQSDGRRKPEGIPFLDGRAVMLFKRLLEFTATTRALVGTGVVTGVLLVIVFPALPIGGGLLDARFGYTFDDAMAAMASYGEGGRRVYLWASMTLDTLLPVAYAGFLAGILHRFRPREGLWVLASLPVAAAVLDLAENVQIAAMLIQYPEVSTRQVAWSSLTTQLKTTVFLAGLTLAAVFVAWKGARRWMNA